jgi:hypothetical protein
MTQEQREQVVLNYCIAAVVVAGISWQTGFWPLAVISCVLLGRAWECEGRDQ